MLLNKFLLYILIIGYGYDEGAIRIYSVNSPVSSIMTISAFSHSLKLRSQTVLRTSFMEISGNCSHCLYPRIYF